MLIHSRTAENTRIRHQYAPLALLPLCLLLAFACHAGQPAQTEGIFDPAFGPDDIDLAQCKQSRDGVESAAKPAHVLAALGLKAGESWSYERNSGPNGKETHYHYMLALKGTAKAGSFSLGGCDADGLLARTVYYLKADAPLSTAAENEKNWVPFPVAQPGAAAHFTLPPGIQTRAFRVTDVRMSRDSALENWRFYKRRLFDNTPGAAGIGERGSFCFHPSAVTHGQLWQNAALDPDPTSKATKILHPPVSDVAPSWFILTWEQPRALTGILLRSNATKYKIYSFTGDVRVNPALASADDWARVTYTVPHEEKVDADKTTHFSRWLAFEPLKTQAIKVVVTDCAPKGSQVFSISTFDALTDLGEAPVPARTSDAPAFNVAYNLAQAGETALSVKGPDGRVIRSLFAQLERATGEHTEGWDLKDDQGKTVAPGVYQWEAINAPPIELNYDMTVTPNIEARTTERTPWYQEMSGPHGWMADHAMATTCTTLGDKLYLGAPGVEGGTAFIECDLNGVKQWGKVNFGAWTGVGRLAADTNAIMIYAGNTLYRMDPATHEIKDLCPINTPQRKGYMQSMTAHDGKTYIARSSPVPFVDNAVLDWQVDLDHCLPVYPKEVRGNYRTVPNPRLDFMRVLRLTGTPPGQDQPPDNKPQTNWPVFLESTQGAGRRQFVMVTFKEPVPIGSLIFPHPGGKMKINFSVLKPNAAYPPDASRESDWVPFEKQGAPGFECIAAPANTITRALRITFIQPGSELDDMMDTASENPASKPAVGGDMFDKKGDAAGAKGWTGRLEGLRIVRRRLQNLFPTAKVRVNSGAISPDGVWDAKRIEALSAVNPGIYLMEWDTPQDVCALAIKEIDGMKTEIDVWTGAETGAIPLDGTDGWKNVATYEQIRRWYYEPDFNRNDHARYMDGNVNFEQPIKTRAVRLRVVAQWLETETYPRGQRADLGGKNLDPTRCRIFGVAPLGNLGGEAPLDTRVYQGLDIIDSQTGKLQETVNCDPGYSVSMTPAGEVCTLKNYAIQKIDLKTGQCTPIVKDLKSPERLTIGTDGSFYVFCGHEGGSIIRVFDKDGKPIREIGHAGGPQPGPWDPQRLSRVNELCIDKTGNLWVMDTDDQPRRTVEFKTDGTFVRELLGNTHYGGGGTLNRYDVTRAYLGRTEFEIDWEKRTSRVRGLLADRIYGDDLVPIRIKERTYLVTTPLSYSADQQFACVYLYDDAKGTARLTAAMGEAVAFEPMFQPAVVGAMKGKTPREFKFIWCDLNGDGKVDVAEVKLELKAPQENVRLGRFDDGLACAAGSTLYAVKEYLPDGTPIYEAKPLPAAGQFRLNDGRIFAINGQSPTSKSMENALYTPQGEHLWGYPVEHPSVSGLWLPPWRPGYVSNQFAIIGHETARGGDLGEYLVIHANNGQWNIWTTDGFLAGHMLFHLLDKRSHGFGPATSPRGTRMDPLTAGQEHFHGFMMQSEKDGRALIVAGGNWMSLIEVKGLERFKRTHGEIKVTPEDIQRVHIWESEHTRREILSSVPVIECHRAPSSPHVDGLRGENEWTEASAKLEDVTFTMEYDPTTLYFSFTGSGIGNLKNSGAEFQRYFKTGASLDVQIGTDPQADPAREHPVAGDLRLLFTFVQDKPRVVLYQPVAPGAKPEEAWETFTAVAGKTHFDRVVVLDSARLAMNTTDKNGIIEASVPLKDLGLKIVPGLRLKMDWGVLYSREGNSVQSRSYWTNKMANGVSDESFESRLEPNLWGYVQFPASGTGTGSKIVPGMDLNTKKDGDILDILEK